MIFIVLVRSEGFFVPVVKLDKFYPISETEDFYPVVRLESLGEIPVFIKGFMKH